MNNLLTFLIDQQTYALAIEPIWKIVSMVTITPVPQASSLAEGVINVEGEAVPVVDLRTHLGLPRREYLDYTPIILMEFQQRLVGLVVDEVKDVLGFKASEMSRPEDILPAELHNAALLVGVIYQSTKPVLVLDAEQIFQLDQVEALMKVVEYLQSQKVMP